MDDWLQEMREDLELAGLSEGTRRAYLACAKAFADFLGRSPRSSRRTEVRGWVRRLIAEQSSPARLRKHFAALRFLFRKTLGRGHLVSFLSWPRDPPREPVVLSVPEMGRLLDELSAPVYRAFFATMYATGLRLSEARLLETRDVDPDRGLIHVRRGKGGKRRDVVLSAELLALLRVYWVVEQPASPWLFAGPAGCALRPGSARTELRRAARRAGIARRVTPHVLRHCFATHLLDAGTELCVIQALLGHASIRSTTRYAHLTESRLLRTTCLLASLARARASATERGLRARS